MDKSSLGIVSGIVLVSLSSAVSADMVSGPEILVLPAIFLITILLVIATIGIVAWFFAKKIINAGYVPVPEKKKEDLNALKK